MYKINVDVVNDKESIWDIRRESSKWNLSFCLSPHSWNDWQLHIYLVFFFKEFLCAFARLSDVCAQKILYLLFALISCMIVCLLCLQSSDKSNTIFDVNKCNLHWMKCNRRSRYASKGGASYKIYRAVKYKFWKSFPLTFAHICTLTCSKHLFECNLISHHLLQLF